MLRGGGKEINYIRPKETKRHNHCHFTKDQKLKHYQNKNKLKRKQN